MNITLSRNDEIVMKLIHYFITEKGYNPIVLHGAKDEIWLENTEEDYQIVRIVTNYIHNDEQLNFDIYRTKQIMKRISKKTFSLNMNALSIFVNLGDNVDIENNKYKNVDLAYLTSFKDLNKYDFIKEQFPNILEFEKTEEKGLELFMKITEDINAKNSAEAQKAEEIFAKKVPIVTYILMFICTVMYIITSFQSANPIKMDGTVLTNLGGLVKTKQVTELYTLVTSVFLHADIFHFFFNMYALYVLGSQLESFFGKVKFSIIYIISGIIGNLFTLLFLPSDHVAVGASGAIFGLLGAMLYFGYHYRIYLSEVLKTQIIPLIIVNFFISMLAGFNNIAHFGGLFGGYLITKMVGVKYKSTTFDIINGFVMSAILIIFLLYMVLGG